MLASFTAARIQHRAAEAVPCKQSTRRRFDRLIHPRQFAWQGRLAHHAPPPPPPSIHPLHPAPGPKPQFNPPSSRNLAFANSSSFACRQALSCRLASSAVLRFTSTPGASSPCVVQHRRIRPLENAPAGQKEGVMAGRNMDCLSVIRSVEALL